MGSPQTAAARQAARLAGLAAVGGGGPLGGYLSFRLAAGANHTEAVPHLVKPGWQYLVTDSDVPESAPVRRMLGEVPVVAVRCRSQVHVLADRWMKSAAAWLATGAIRCRRRGLT
jgi:hypothetical protein